MVRSLFHLEHLEAVLRRTPSTEARGACFFRSTALVLDMPAWTLCIGTLPGVSEEAFLAKRTSSPTDFIHCWVEFNDRAVSPSALTREDDELIFHDRIAYRDGHAARDVRQVAGRRVGALARANGWDRFILDGTPVFGGEIVPTLMAEAELPFEISARGGVVPVGTVMPPYAV